MLSMITNSTVHIRDPKVDWPHLYEIRYTERLRCHKIDKDHWEKHDRSMRNFWDHEINEWERSELRKKHKKRKKKA